MWESGHTPSLRMGGVGIIGRGGEAECIISENRGNFLETHSSRVPSWLPRNFILPSLNYHMRVGGCRRQPLPPATLSQSGYRQVYIDTTPIA